MTLILPQGGSGLGGRGICITSVISFEGSPESYYQRRDYTCPVSMEGGVSPLSGRRLWVYDELTAKELAQVV